MVGIYPESSGKTVMASSLVSALRREGFDTVPFKPVGGTDIWQNPLVLGESKKLRVLATGDAISLRRPLGDYPIELVNPQGMLITPIDPERYQWRVKDLLGVHGLSKRVVLARISFCRDRVYTTHIYNTNASRRAPSRIEATILEVAGLLAPTPVRGSDDTIEAILLGEYAGEADACLQAVESRHDIVIIESNSSVAAPTHLSAKPDLVVAVSPGSAYIVEGERYSKAIDALALGGKPWSVEAWEAVALARAAESIQLPILDDPLEGYSPRDLSPVIDRVKTASRQ